MNGFSWVIENEIAGMARPQLRADALWEWLAGQGIGLVVSLTRDAPDAGLLARFGVDLAHLPVPDFTPPTPAGIDEFLEKAHFYRHEGKSIVVHCGAGMGRTGTMIACYLVGKGMSAADAIEIVRQARPGSIETLAQEECVVELAARLDAGA